MMKGVETPSGSCKASLPQWNVNLTASTKMVGARVQTFQIDLIRLDSTSVDLLKL